MGACLSGYVALKRASPMERKRGLASLPAGHVDPQCRTPLLASTARGGQAILLRKLIFLDIDGPLVCWKNGREHAWDESQSLSDAAYSANFQALLRVINGAGGVEVVKVVISSNWRTDERKYGWLVKQLMTYGVEVIGHTDKLNVHPAKAGSSVLSRDLEIQRVLERRIVGTRGPYVAEDGTNAFEPASLPESWQITHWIAIDDLDLASPRLHRLGEVRYVSRFLPTSSDNDHGKGWMLLPDNFANATRKWVSAFASSNFVKVDPQKGLGGTRRAEARAIRLLGGQ